MHTFCASRTRTVSLFLAYGSPSQPCMPSNLVRGLQTLRTNPQPTCNNSVWLQVDTQKGITQDQDEACEVGGHLLVVVPLSLLNSSTILRVAVCSFEWQSRDVSGRCTLNPLNLHLWTAKTTREGISNAPHPSARGRKATRSKPFLSGCHEIVSECKQLRQCVTSLCFQFRQWFLRLQRNSTT